MTLKIFLVLGIMVFCMGESKGKMYFLFTAKCEDCSIVNNTYIGKNILGWSLSIL